MTTKQQGHIKKWQDDKGFGFIETEPASQYFSMSVSLKRSVVLMLVSKWYSQWGKTIKGASKPNKYKS